MFKCPCEDCICLPICRHVYWKSNLIAVLNKCSLAYDYLDIESDYEFGKRLQKMRKELKHVRKM